MRPRSPPITRRNAVVISPTGGVLEGRDDIQRIYQVWFTAFPDLRFTERDLLIDGDRVVLIMTIVGTHAGDFFGLPASGRQVRAVCAFVYTLQDNQIVHERRILDFTGVLVQVGVLRAKPATGPVAGEPESARITPSQVDVCHRSPCTHRRRLARPPRRPNPIVDGSAKRWIAFQRGRSRRNAGPAGGRGAARSHGSDCHYLVATALGVEVRGAPQFHVASAVDLARSTGALGDVPTAVRLVHFHLLNGVVSLAGNVVITMLLTGVAGLDPISSNLIAIVGCSFVNFAASNAMVFSDVVARAGCART